MWSCDEGAIGIPGARHKMPWNAIAIIGQGICRSWDVSFKRSVQNHFCGMFRPRELQLMEIRGMSCGRIECTTHILGFLVLTSLVVPIYQSGKVTYISPNRDV